jgi:RNA polymerase sigma factor (TIGR02999 family)
MADVTRILSQIEQGDPSAAQELLPLVYDELRKLAAARLAEERPGQTLQATALVHEAYIRLVDVSQAQQWTSRRHFFGAAAEAMRRILVENARRRKRLKHGGEFDRADVDLGQLAEAPPDGMLEALDEALEKLGRIDAVACELVKLRYFAGLSLRDAGKVLETPPRTADRLWTYAKAWLLREIKRTADGSG